ELAAVEEAEALGRRRRGRRPVGLLPLVPRVELGDDPPLLGDTLRGEAARDRKGLAVVREHLVGMAAAARLLGHLLDGVDAVRPVGVAVAIAAEVAQLDEVREAAGHRRLDLTTILAQLRLDERQSEERVGLRLVAEGPELGVRSGEGLAILADPQEPVLGEAPAEVARERAQADVVLLASREVDARGAGLAGRHDHEVDLWAAQEANRRLVRSA